jgi:hypothetical protein
MNLPAVSPNLPQSRSPEPGSPRNASAQENAAARNRPVDTVDLGHGSVGNLLHNSQQQGEADVLLATLRAELRGLSEGIARRYGGAQDGRGQQGVTADFQASLSYLIEAGPDTASDYLAAVHALLSDDADPDALGTFLADLTARLSGATTGASTDQVFQEAMGRLGSVHQLSVEASVEAQVTIEMRLAGAPEEADPLVLDMAGDGISLTGAERGARFDINGDGQAEQTSFVEGDDAFLALDRNGNGRVDNGRELFGDQNGAANGFEELARYDANRDGKIDRQDPVFQRLRLYQDRNLNGVTDPGELRGLEEAGVASIGLSYRQVNERLDSGDRLAQRGGFVRADGTAGTAADAMVGFLDIRA